jgi:hypothetical protein
LLAKHFQQDASKQSKMLTRIKQDVHVTVSVGYTPCEWTKVTPDAVDLLRHSDDELKDNSESVEQEKDLFVVKLAP